ncbi:Hypothetical protein POVR1_LOCUS141 [uncultured virus]|nr:Hypothetical protein POVR1_LOCUS141 [uncultured virus]
MAIGEIAVVVLLLIVVIIVAVIIYNLWYRPLNVLRPGIDFIGPGDPLLPLEFPNGVINPIAARLNPGLQVISPSAASINPVAQSLTPPFESVIIPDDLPDPLIDCIFFGTFVQNNQPCPVGSDYLDPILNQGQGCFSRPCPPGFKRGGQCYCIRP